MSIPPLVCSTPPPPDQCEDDKDPEDFDIQYNLSQDDDDDNYDFGSFSTFNHFQTSQKKSDPIIAKVVESDNSSNRQKDAIENVEADNTTENKLKIEEETNVEDLNLEDLKVDQDTVEKIENIEYNVDTKPNDPVIDSVQETQDLGNLTNVNSAADNIHASALKSDELDIEPCSIDQPEEPPSYVDEIIAAVDNLQMTPTEPDLPLDIHEIDDEPSQETKIPEFEEELTVTSEIVTQYRGEVDADDDFGDFDDFQFASPGDKPATLVTCDNPWDKNDDATGNEFGDFKANFDNNNTVLEKPEHSPAETTDDQVKESNSVLALAPDTPNDDDFGNFNDFQSSSTEVQLAADSEDGMPLNLLDLQLPEDKLVECITSFLYEIYQDEVPEPEEEAQANLDSVLGVTWNHLLQTDERQPYMVNWNNSLGQKTLLKSLCIDSRNILFGPKWNYNMPKYAATLSAAPLQPQKQITSPSTSHIETANPEKLVCKPPGTWSDPFTSDGQESCNPDAPSENPVIETGPTDLDVFEASTSSKPDKIFSSTLNMQPLRQISLPDTHIFTPTDSETPRSTTIHYDNSPTVLLPQTVIDTSKSEPNFKSEPQTLPSQVNADDTDEYWEFQDFKGPSNTTKDPFNNAKGTSTNTTTSASETSKPNPNIVHATQVLQPIKVEPIIPTLNWPDPGEVKETFDDFSDFVSSSSLSNHPQQTPTVPVQKIVNKPANDLNIAGPSKTVAAPTERLTNDTIGDDDFDTFQSALPSTSSVDLNFSSVSKDSNAAVGKPIISSPAPPRKMTDFDFAFPKVENVKSNTISNENVNKPKDSFVKNQMPILPSNLEVKSPSVQPPNTVMSTGLLQPTPASLSATLPSQQQSGQILQPLSLESFSQINWPNPGIDLQDLSRFNPVETLHSLKSDLSVNSQSKVASPVHNQKNQKGAASNQSPDDDWGDFVSSAPKPQQQTMPKKQTTTFADDDEWTDFVSSPSVKPQNGLNTISLNVHTNFQSKPSKLPKGKKVPLEIPSLNYITPKSGSHKSYNDRHFQNL